jgi:hypothetical protein
MQQFCCSYKQAIIMKNKIYAVLALGLSMAAMAFINKPKEKFRNLSADVVIAWNLISHEAMGGKDYKPLVNYHPLIASRVHSMVHLAMHDALNAIQAVYASYAYTGKMKGADPEVAAATAAYTVLVASFPDKKEMLDMRLKEWVNKAKFADAKAKGMQVGQQAGLAIIELRKKDGAAEGSWTAPLQSSGKPGIYQLTPPFNFVVAPHWATMKTFSLKKYDQFRCPPPPALNSKAYTDGFNEVKDYGGKTSMLRNADQTFYAKFWYELSEVGWNRIGRIVTKDKKLGLWESARLFALLNMALADAYTSGWDSKFHYNFWRPYTAIHFADTDNNSNTAIDLNWESLEVTPPVHDYPSTHSALGNAGAAVLAGLVGDNTSFTMTSGSSEPAGATRSFSSFSQAANENADSRVMAGLHFRFSCKAGQDLGSKVGQWTVQNHLRPLK